MSSRSVVRIDSGEGLDHTDWEELLGDGDFHVSPAWLRGGKALRLPVAYLLLRSAPCGRSIAGLPCSLITQDTPLLFARVDHVIERLFSQRLGSRPPLDVSDVLMPSLICGGRQVGHSSFLTQPSSEITDTAIRDLLLHAETVAVEFGARSISVLYVEAHKETLRNALRDSGFIEFFHTHRSTLDLDFDDFDGYLRTLSAGRRSGVRRELRKLDEASVELTIEPLTEELVGTLARLADASGRKYGAMLTQEFHERALHNHIKNFGDRVVLALARRNDAIYGYAHFIRWRDQLFAGRIGFDYDLKGSLPVYFAVLFYEPIKFGLATRAKAIDYGIDFVQTKVSRGCRTTPLYGYVKCLGVPDAELRRALRVLNSEILVADCS